ncbi:MAG: 3-oxoacyl-ACP synthase [Bacteroidales bacterium]|nr:3-oxoacyl-ACP synthase [Bacteroidales bacterium]
MSVRIIADNIISPLGETTDANVESVRQGRSALRVHRLPDMPEAFVASLFEQPVTFVEGMIRTIEAALDNARSRGISIDPAGDDVLYVFSSTKGNVAEMQRLGTSAEEVSTHFGSRRRPVVVSNACISGLSAQLLALRMLRAGYARYAIVAGLDVQGRFIVSGFQSFKALSPEECRPFDGDRCGLNLGEAAACMILTADDTVAPGQGWTIRDGAVRNDAVHISNPSRTGEGCLRALQQVIDPECRPTCISAHGTATLYNDEMEAAAIDRAGLSEVPTFSLKGYYGHTMGAAGILETIITLHSVCQGWIPATRGYAEEGTSHPVCVSGHKVPAQGRDVIKLLSGFGGCNAALRYSDQALDTPVRTIGPDALRTLCSVHLSPAEMPEGMTARYKAQVGDYPKFYKMDPLCKLGFLAAEELVRMANDGADHSEDRAIVLFTRNGSMADDQAYLETISSPDAYYPSPAVFVYTLPNIVTGELAIRHHYHCETSCYVLEEKDWSLIHNIIATTFQDRGVKSVLAGWLDYVDDEHYEADLAVYEP